MKKKLFCLIFLAFVSVINIMANGGSSSYCLIYVTVDNESDLYAVADRVNQLTNEAEKDGSKYLFFLSNGSNPVVTNKPQEAKTLINGIFSIGTKPTIIPDVEIESLFREIAKTDFAALDPEMNMAYLTNKIRFHFIINKNFIALNYQQKIIGKLLSSCMLDKTKTQDCDFYSTVYLGKDISARKYLNSIYPLGELFPFNYNKNITDDK